MTFTLLARRSNVPGKAPTATQLTLGEMSINTYDGLLYFAKNQGGANSVVVLGPVPPTANALATAVTIALSGDASGAVAFNGAANVSIATTLAAVGTAGTYTAVSTDAKGRVISGIAMTATGDAAGTAVGTNLPLTLASVGTAGTYTAVSTDSKGRIISGVAMTATGDAAGTAVGINLPLTLANIGSIGSYTYVTTDSKGRVISGGNVTASGDATGIAAGTIIPLTLANVGTAASYSYVTTDTKGRVISGGNIIAAGDATGTASGGTINLTLANVGVAGLYSFITTDSKGRVIGGEYYTVTLMGDVNASINSANVVATLTAVGTAGTYSVVTTDTKGRVVSGASLTASGDATGTANGTNIVLTLAGTTVAAGSYGAFAVDAKGRLTYARAASFSDITTALSFTPVNKAGDTMTGGLTTPGLVVSGTANLAGLTVSGMANLSNVTTATLNVNGILTVAGNTYLSNAMAATVAAGDATTNVATTAFVANTIGNYLPLTGGTMQGRLTATGLVAGYGTNKNTGNFITVLVTDGYTGGLVIANALSNFPKWAITKQATAGGDDTSGSDLGFAAWYTSGSSITPLSLSRGNGVVSAPYGITTLTQPATDNTTNVATTAFVTSTVTNYLPLSGGTMTGPLVTKGLLCNFVTPANTFVNMMVPDGYFGGFKLTNTTNSNKWSIIKAANTASDGFSGSDLQILSYYDIGGPSIPFTISRGNGIVSAPFGVTTLTPAAADNTTNVATTAWVTTAALASVGTAGTYTAVVTDARGRVVSGVAMTATGDATGTAAGTNIVLTLAGTTVAAGSYGAFAVDAKGRLTYARAASSSDITTALGFTPVNKAGDMMTGALTVPGLTVSGASNLTGGNVYFPGSGTGVYLANEPNFCYTGSSSNYVDPEVGIGRDAKFGYLGICVTGGINTDTFKVRTSATAVNPAAGDNSIAIATTAWVTNAIVLPNVITAGSYTTVVVTSKGAVTSGLAISNTTTLTTTTGTIAQQSSTGALTFGASTPTSAGGTSLWSRSVTPQSAASRFVLNMSCMVDNSAINSVGVLLFRGAVCIGIGAASISKAGNAPAMITIQVVDAPATANAVTYSAYYGTINGSGTTFINRMASYSLGSSTTSGYTITELAA